MLVQWWPAVYDVGPTLNQHLVNVSVFHGNDSYERRTNHAKGFWTIYIHIFVGAAFVRVIVTEVSGIRPYGCGPWHTTRPSRVVVDVTGDLKRCKSLNRVKIFILLNVFEEFHLMFLTPVRIISATRNDAGPKSLDRVKILLLIKVYSKNSPRYAFNTSLFLLIFIHIGMGIGAEIPIPV